jgi:hypothetical protein
MVVTSAGREGMQLHTYSVMYPQELLDISCKKIFELALGSEVILKFLETYLPCYVVTLFETCVRHAVQ